MMRYRSNKADKHLPSVRIPEVDPVGEQRQPIRPQTSNTSVEMEEEKDTTVNEQVFFHLKTESGELKYKPADYGSHTDFVRAIIELSIAFNSPEVDPEFRNVMKRALAAYESGESLDEFESEDSEDEEDGTDYVQDELAIAREQAEKFEEASKLVSNLPAVDELRLQILSTKESNTSHVDKILSKNTDLPPNMVSEAISKNVPFILPSHKAKELYIQLRMLDVTLSIKPTNSISEVKTSVPTIKKGSAAKNNPKNLGKAKTQRTKKPVKDFPITGHEKLKQSDGLINNG